MTPDRFDSEWPGGREDSRAPAKRTTPVRFWPGPYDWRWCLHVALNAVLLGVIWGLGWWGMSALWPSAYSPKVPLLVAIVAAVAYVRGRQAERAASTREQRP